MRAGFPPDTAADTAMRMLTQSACRQYLAELSGSSPVPLRQLVLAGLTRLAFGQANDAVRLVFAGELPDAGTLAQLDLFQVSELRRDKNGGVEVRLFDRQRALEKLLECASDTDARQAAERLLSAFGCSGREADDEAITDAGEVLGQAADGAALVAPDKDAPA